MAHWVAGLAHEIITQDLGCRMRVKRLVLRSGQIFHKYVFLRAPLIWMTQSKNMQKQASVEVYILHKSRFAHEYSGGENLRLQLLIAKDAVNVLEFKLSF